jgi:hypothetical protein
VRHSTGKVVLIELVPRNVEPWSNSR